MIANFLFIAFMFVWALAIRYNPIQPDYIIAVTMVLPFLVNILPMLVLGVRLPPGYLRLSWTHFNRAPFKLVIPGALMSSAAIFFLVMSDSYNAISMLFAGGSICFGSMFVIYAHNHKLEPDKVF